MRAADCDMAAAQYFRLPTRHHLPVNGVLSPHQKLFFSSGASRNCCVVILMINQKVFRPPRRRSDPSWVTSVGHFSGHSRGSLLCFFFQNDISFILLCWDHMSATDVGSDPTAYHLLLPPRALGRPLCAVWTAPVLE